MQPKTIKITYWVLVIILCLFMLADGVGGITMQQQGITALKHLGFPSYIMPLMGWLKILGAIALLQPNYIRIKEWVFAGLTFVFIGAAVSHICVKDPVNHIMMPVIFLAFMFIVYFYWNKYKTVKNISALHLR